ncbi:DUF4783 domain-containing protein [Fulvivirga sp. RKSG066]|uniref:DUF4783 domain-containing protein n=1 Tax=Fulvivirga aurantia TaxID=2529383 RepID=UPI0012BC85B6|nr:DUF4783 domain-containing protein [Fulvivirga aurantia]MTI20614.1 DUF4783 domain-containing protein [Fulvivirga aurantia]
MKNLVRNSILLLFTVFLSQIAFAQSDITNDVKEAIKAGSSKECSKFFNESLDVTIDGEMKSYSRIQAEYVLRDFFKAHPPTSFNIVHEGSSKGGLAFAIGQYVSKQDTYRVWMRIKNTGNQYLIHEISFIQE